MCVGEGSERLRKPSGGNFHPSLSRYGLAVFGESEEEEEEDQEADRARRGQQEIRLMKKSKESSRVTVLFLSSVTGDSCRTEKSD